MGSDPAKFIARDEAYDQHMGYPLWCAHVLDKINETAPFDARDLVELVTEYIGKREEDPEYGAIFERCKPALARFGLEAKLGDITHFASQSVFGPAAHHDFGNKSDPVCTMICPDENISGSRGYYRMLKRNYLDHVTPDGKLAFEKPITFSYPIPGTDRKLQLRSIGYAKDVLADLPKKPQDAEDHDIYYRHTVLRDSEHNYNDFMECLKPLYEVIRDKHASQTDRMDAVITFYWLDMQATPIKRGGSAHARILLEHLAQEIGMEVPFMQEGYDLGFEASTTSLDTFKQRFRDGVFFDKEATSADIFKLQEKKIRKSGQKAMKQELDDVKRFMDQFINCDIVYKSVGPNRRLAVNIQQEFNHAFLRSRFREPPAIDGPPIHADNLVRDELLRLAAASKRLAQEPYVALNDPTFDPIERVGEHMEVISEEYNYVMTESSHTMLKAFMDVTLPRIARELETDGDWLHPELRKELKEAIESLWETLPVVLAKSEQAEKMQSSGKKWTR